jgi:Flp pilus assembly protein TadG
VRVVGDFRRSQSGSVAAIFALGLPALFGLVGVAVDYSSFVSQRVRLQKAADAAALATTSELSSNAVADQSAYTVIVRRVQLKQAPNLVLNANYHQTDVPLPEGLKGRGGVRLIQ